LTGLGPALTESFSQEFANFPASIIAWDGEVNLVTLAVLGRGRHYDPGILRTLNATGPAFIEFSPPDGHHRQGGPAWGRDNDRDRPRWSDHRGGGRGLCLIGHIVGAVIVGIVIVAAVRYVRRRRRQSRERDADAIPPVVAGGHCPGQFFAPPGYAQWQGEETES
jgi:hypothetical protein